LSLAIQEKNASTKEGECFETTRAAKYEFDVLGTSHIFWVTFSVE